MIRRKLGALIVSFLALVFLSGAVFSTKDMAIEFVRFLKNGDFAKAYGLFSPEAKSKMTPLVFEIHQKENLEGKVVMVEEIILEQEKLKPNEITLPKLLPFFDLTRRQKRRLFYFDFEGGKKTVFGVDTKATRQGTFVTDFEPLPNLQALLSEKNPKIAVRELRKVA